MGEPKDVDKISLDKVITPVLEKHEAVKPTQKLNSRERHTQAEVQIPGRPVKGTQITKAQKRQGLQGLLVRSPRRLFSLNNQFSA